MIHATWTSVGNNQMRIKTDDALQIKSRAL